MPPLFLNRFLRAVSLLHPRSLAERARFHAQLVQRNERLMQQVDALTSEMRSLGAQLDTVSLREQQLRAVLHADATGDDRVLGFQAMLDGIELEQHIRKATCKAELHLDPFPHCVVDGLFPKAYYNALVEAIPRWSCSATA